MVFCPNRERFRLHQVELGTVPFTHFCGLEDRTEQPAIVGQQDRLNDIQIPLRFNVIVISDTPDAQCFIIHMDDADSAVTKPLHRILTLELDQAVTEWSGNVGQIIPLVPGWKYGWNSDFEPFFLLNHADPHCRYNGIINGFGTFPKHPTSQVPELHSIFLCTADEAI